MKHMKPNHSGAIHPQQATHEHGSSRPFSSTQSDTPEDERSFRRVEVTGLRGYVRAEHVAITKKRK